jgi:hypothetical protein
VFTSICFPVWTTPPIYWILVGRVFVVNYIANIYSRSIGIFLDANAVPAVSTISTYIWLFTFNGKFTTDVLYTPADEVIIDYPEI